MRKAAQHRRVSISEACVAGRRSLCAGVRVLGRGLRERDRRRERKRERERERETDRQSERESCTVCVVTLDRYLKEEERKRERYSVARATESACVRVLDLRTESPALATASKHLQVM